MLRFESKFRTYTETINVKNFVCFNIQTDHDPVELFWFCIQNELIEFGKSYSDMDPFAILAIKLLRNGIPFTIEANYQSHSDDEENYDYFIIWTLVIKDPKIATFVKLKYL